MIAAQDPAATLTGRDVADWQGLFAFHEEDRWSALLREPLWECAQAAEVGDCQFRLTREWQRGPHLRLGVRGPVEAAATVRAQIDQRLHAVLRSSPSTRTVTLADVQDRAQQLAVRSAVELRQDWLADNSLTWTSGGVTVAGVAEPRTQALLEDFHYAATVPALRLLRAVPRERIGLTCADLMAVTAQKFGRGGLVSAAMSFRSHAEAYLNLDAAADVRAAWDVDARRSAPALRRRLLAVADGPNVPAHAREWLEAITPVVQAAQQAQNRGELALPTMAQGFSADLTKRSAFHRALAGSAEWEDVRTSDWFLIYRFAISLLYLQLSRLGVDPVGRYRLCHLLATALAECEDPTMTTEEGDS